jgi:hypothetical protein
LRDLSLVSFVSFNFQEISFKNISIIVDQRLENAWSVTRM